jgi:hypothetical protein
MGIRKKCLVIVGGLVLLMTVLVVPASATPTETYTATDHSVSAFFNTAGGDGTVTINAKWYSPQSADTWPFPPESNLYVTYWGSNIGHDCDFSQRIEQWDMKWSLNHAYVAFNTDCGFFELYVQGNRGVEPEHEWNHYNSYWNGQHQIRNQRWNSDGTTAALYLDGQPVNVILGGAGIAMTNVTIAR